MLLTLNYYPRWYRSRTAQSN